VPRGRWRSTPGSARPASRAVSEQPDPFHLTIAERLAELTGRPVERVTGADDHEVYLARPEVLAKWVSSR
jgi:hypothetical protein